MDSAGLSSPLGGQVAQAAAPVAQAAAPVAVSPAQPQGLFSGLMPQSPEMASNLQNIAPGLSKALNGGKPVDAANPYGRNLFTGEAMTEKQHNARMGVLNSLGAQAMAPARAAPMPQANFGPAGGSGRSLQEYLQAMLKKLNGGGGL